MIRTIHICDRCKKQAETKEELDALALHRVILGTDVFYYSHNRDGEVAKPHPRWEQQWCLACRKETGLHVVMEKKYNTPEAEVPTLESMVREIVRQEIQQ